MNRPIRALLTFVAVLVHAALTWYVWIQGQQLILTILLLFASALLVGWLNPVEPTASEPVPLEPENSLMQPMAGLVALAVTWFAMQAAINEKWLMLVGCLLAASGLWRMAVPAPLPDLSKKAWIAMGLGVLGVAAAFRLYQAGAVPYGLCWADEPLLWMRTNAYFDGLRQSYATGENLFEGIIPFYLMTAGLKAFGRTVTGWRMESILLGVALTPVIWAIGREIAGRWAGWLAAAFWAFSVWPVSHSRVPFFMMETLAVVLGTLGLLFLALRKGRGWLWSLAGLFWGFCFNAYPAARVMLALAPWLLLLHAAFSRPHRATVRAAVVPLLGGFLIGLSPLILWAIKDPNEFKGHYFAALQLGHMVGNVEGSLLQRISGVLQRCVGQFPASFCMWTKRGPIDPFYFPIEYPIIQPALFFLFLAGMGISLARFRRPLHAFLVYWWFVGLLPAVASAPGVTPNDRRVILALPATLLLAGVGLSGILGVFSRWIQGPWRRWAVLGAALAVLAPMAVLSWHDYFERNQKDYRLMDWYYANHTAVLRVLQQENAKGACLLISTKRINWDSWMQPNVNHTRGPAEPATNPGMPVLWAQESTAWYQDGGFINSLRWAMTQRQGAKAGEMAGQPYDILVTLTPFHFYLEPMLQRLGGILAAEVPLKRARQGLMRMDVGMAPDDKLVAKIYRFKRLRGDLLDAEEAAGRYQFSVQQLEPPRPFTRDQVRFMHSDKPEYRQMVEGYKSRPGAWAATGAPLRFSLTDPWFWHTHGTLPGGVRSPMRLTVSLKLEIPADGDYAFGASATGLGIVRLNGKKVFERDGQDPKLWVDKALPERFYHPNQVEFETERRGYVGEPQKLRKGSYRLDYEFVKMSADPIFNDVVRVVWQAPGRSIETLPLEVGRPWPAKP